MQIKEPNDDARLAALNRTNGRAAEPRRAEEPQPSERVKPVDERREQSYQVRKKGDRRKGDRRKENRKVLLDTRSKRERRKGPRRTQEQETQAQNNPPDGASTGIDVEC